jgi:mono/diheme cytochrome c family protein
MTWKVAWCLAALSGAVAATPAGAQFLSKPTRPQVETPRGPVRQIILRRCSACHGIDDYAYNALDRAGWDEHLTAKHRGLDVPFPAADRSVLLDWLSMRFGPDTKPFPRTYVAREATTFLSDAEAETLIQRSCSTCHGVEKVNDARFAADRWRVVIVDMRERGAQISDAELERLVEWLGRVKGTNQ